MTVAHPVTSRTALFAAWMTLAVVGAWAIDESADTVVANTVILGLTGVVTLVRPFRGSHLLVTFVGGTALGLVHGLRIDASGGAFDPLDFVPGLTAVLGIVFTAYFASRINTALRMTTSEDGDMDASLQRVGPGAPGGTGTSKRAHMRGLIAQEVNRAQRYEHSFCVLVLAPDKWQKHIECMDPAQLSRISAEFELHLLARLRTTDTIIQVEDARFIIMLPETNVEGAHVVARKLAIAGESFLGIEVRTGIGAFPDDGITAEQLLSEAEAALTFAESAGIALASRTLLR